MNVLIVYAHPNRKSFCRAVLQKVTAGLKDAGHTVDLIDLYAIHFNPVFNQRDYPSYVAESMQPDMLRDMIASQPIMNWFGGMPKKLLASHLGQRLDFTAFARLIRHLAPRQIVAHQKKITWADGLVFIAPVYWLGFPNILKGWFERVFTYGFAYALTPEGWQGYVRGRVPLLKQQKALVISTTLFREEGYKPMLERAMTAIVDEWGLRYPGVKKVEHVYFYGVPVVDDATRRDYLRQAYGLGREFLPSETPVLAPKGVTRVVPGSPLSVTATAGEPRG